MVRESADGPTASFLIGTRDNRWDIRRETCATDYRQDEKPTFVLFVDLTAAFDHAERSWLFKSIHQRLVNDTEKS